jgi:arylsulfatase A-like enzyme
VLSVWVHEPHLPIAADPRFSGLYPGHPNSEHLGDITQMEDRTIDGVSMVPAFAGKPVERKVPLFWCTHCSPPGDRVAMRIGDWKIIANDQLDTFELYEMQKDWKEENNLITALPEKAKEMQDAMLKLWKEIEAEGPKEWWQHGKASAKNGGLSY